MASTSPSSDFWKHIHKPLMVIVVAGVFAWLFYIGAIPKTLKFFGVEAEFLKPPKQSTTTPPPRKTIVSTKDWSFPKQWEINYYSTRDKEISILDRTLYISADSSGVELGGANLDKIEVAAQTRVGRAVPINAYGRSRVLSIAVDEGIKIELRYRGKDFAIDVFKVRGSTYNVSVREIPEAYLPLKPATEYLSQS